MELPADYFIVMLNSREEQIVLKRLRIVHTKLINYYVFLRSPSPKCDICATNFSPLILIFKYWRKIRQYKLTTFTNIEKKSYCTTFWNDHKYVSYSRLRSEITAFIVLRTCFYLSSNYIEIQSSYFFYSHCLHNFLFFNYKNKLSVKVKLC